MTEAVDLASEIRRYLRETNTGPTALSRKATNDPSVVGDIIYSGRNVSERNAIRLRETMEENPGGCGRNTTTGGYRSARETSSVMMKRKRTVEVKPCFYCEVRSDIGCKHQPAM